MSFTKARSTSKQKKRQSQGCIYNTKRQPLTQIIHYPQSMLIDEYFLHHNSLLKKKSQTKQRITKQKVIKFIGPQQKNIQQIIKSMDCWTQCQNKIFMIPQRTIVEEQISQILKIFYSKIDKLRSERQSYKLAFNDEKNLRQKNENELKEEIQKLSQQILHVRKQYKTLFQNYDNEQKKRQFYERECQMLQEIIKLNSNINNQTVAESFDLVNQSINLNQDFLIDSQINEQKFSRQQNKNYQPRKLSSNCDNRKTYTHENYQNQSSLFIKPVVNKSINNSRKKTNKKITFQSQSQSNLIETQTEEQTKNRITLQEKQKLQKLLKRHNLQPSQLGDIIEEYLKDLKEQYEKQFQTQQEKNLYLLAKKIDTKIWNNKVKKDIQKIMSSKQISKLKN